MSVYASLRTNIEVYRSLMQGAYDIDSNELAERIATSVASLPVVATARISERSSMVYLRNMIARTQKRIQDLSETVNTEINVAEGYRETLSEIAAYTKWRLGFDLAMSAVFGVIGLGCFIGRRKAAGSIGVFAVIAHILAFLDELDIRRKELEDQTQSLESICDELVNDIALHNVLSDSNQYVVGVMKERFGEAFTSQTLTAEDLMETYDPDAPPLEYSE